MLESTVGHSDYRTPAKHELIDAVLGREIGAASYVARQLHWEYRRHILYDLTAGDGIIYYGEGSWDKSCSPGIFARHGRYRSKIDSPHSIEVYLYERASGTYQTLCENLKLRLPDLGYEPYLAGELLEQWVYKPRGLQQNGSKQIELITTLTPTHNNSREIDFSQYGRGDWLFINNDPNLISDWAYKFESILTAIRQGAIVQVFNTMGCNSGGLKRLPWRKGRDTWLGYIEGVEALVGARYTLDLVLLSVERDTAQWAYLITTPQKWVSLIVPEAVKIFGRHKLELRSFSYLKDRHDYEAEKRRLIHTAKELAEKGELVND